MTIGDHSIMKLGDAFRSGFHKQKWEDAVQKTGKAVDKHGSGERRCRTQVLKIVFANRSWVFCECALDHGRFLVSVGSPLHRRRPHKGARMV